MEGLCLILIFIASFQVEKISRVIESKGKPNTVKSTNKPCPKVSHLHVF